MLRNNLLLLIPAAACAVAGQALSSNNSPALTDDMSRIDTHSHFVPPFWRQSQIENGFEHPDGMPAIPEWSEEEHLKTMEQAGISKSILSITSPGTHLVPGNDAFGRDLTRRCNEFAADLKRRNPDKFGFWASLPLPDVNGSLAEMAYALDELNADGIAIMSSAHGIYPGDSKLAPIFTELNRRKAIIFIHPTSPCIAASNGTVEPAAPLPQYPNPIMEFFFDTARAAVNLFLSGTMKKSPDLTFILSHAAGALPPMIDRFATFAGILLPDDHGVTVESVHETLNRQFYFDLAGIPFPNQIHGLVPFVNASRITYGSDYPYTTSKVVLQLGNQINAELPKVFPKESDQNAILRGNAEKLLKEKGKISPNL